MIIKNLQLGYFHHIKLELLGTFDQLKESDMLIEEDILHNPKPIYTSNKGYYKKGKGSDVL